LSKTVLLLVRALIATTLLGFSILATGSSTDGSQVTSPAVALLAKALPTPITVARWNVEDSGLQWAEIGFDDIAPDYVSLQECWDAMGMDDRGRVYIGFTSDRLTGGEDFAVFRYDPSSGGRTFLGTLMDVALSANNLAPGESIPKGHTRIIFADGKIYIGSQGFHDFKGKIDDLPKYRGAHIFVFDITTNTWQDLAARFAGGIIVKHQGIVALGILPEQHLLVGLTHPNSDIILFNYKTDEIENVISGIPWKLGNPLSREVIVAPSGRIYTYRGTEDPKQREERHSVWVYDPQTDRMSNTGFEMTQGFWIGQTETRDKSKIYVSTTNGELYEFDTATERFKDLGYLLPKASKDAGRKIDLMGGVTLSPDEHKLYYAPAALENPGGSGELYSYDIATGEINFVQQLPPGVYTTADLRDNENIYMAHFGTDDVWRGKGRLIILRAGSTPIKARR
jgi:outer membrane protein assembly factor BamB